jgi:hypothetical protein
MQHACGKIWISVVGIAIATSVAGCGGDEAPGASDAVSVAASIPSSPPVDVDAAFAQYLDSVEPLWCSNAYVEIGDMAVKGNVGAMKVRVYEYSGVLAGWDYNLGRIAVPPAAQPVVDKLRDLNATELADLDALAAVDASDEKQLDRLMRVFYFDDALVAVEVDRLSAALGHPERQGRIAANQLGLAYQTFYTETAAGYDTFEAALGRNDLDGAKAAEVIQEEAAQRYIDGLDAIDWPAQFEDEVNDLRDNLQGVIEFGRLRVDVATAAQVVRTPDEGIPESMAAEAAKASLQGLLTLADESNSPLQC